MRMALSADSGRLQRVQISGLPSQAAFPLTTLPPFILPAPWAYDAEPGEPDMIALSLSVRTGDDVIPSDYPPLNVAPYFFVCWSSGPRSRHVVVLDGTIGATIALPATAMTVNAFVAGPNTGAPAGPPLDFAASAARYPGGPPQSGRVTIPTLIDGEFPLSTGVRRIPGDFCRSVRFIGDYPVHYPARIRMWRDSGGTIPVTPAIIVPDQSTEVAIPGGAMYIEVLVPVAGFTTIGALQFEVL